MPQHQIVLSRSQRQRNRRLPGLLRAIDEHFGAIWFGAHKESVGQRLQRKLLVGDRVGFRLERGLHRLVAFLLYFQAVLYRPEIIEAARRLALVDHAARRSMQNRGCADDIGDHVNRAASGGRHRLAVIPASGVRCERCVVVFDVVHDANFWRGIAQEFEQRGVLHGM